MHLFFLASMFYTYILQSQKDSTFYFGQTGNLSKRLKSHNAGENSYTRTKMPWKLFWHKEFETREEAVRFETKLKNLKSTKRMLEYIKKHSS
jgi:putative endonuclease